MTLLLIDFNQLISYSLHYLLRIYSSRYLKFEYLPHFLSATKPCVEATPCFAFQSFTFPFNIGLSDTAVMDMMVSTLQQQRAVTEQLRREAAIKRIHVSVVVSEIVKYINEHEQEDCLLVGFSSQKVNPFREKSSCTVL